MDRIAFIIGETFIFWSPIILALGALVAVFWFLGLYLGRSANPIGAFMAVPMAFVLSMIIGRLIHWYCRTDSYVSLEAAMTDYTAGGYALLGVFFACILTACILRLIRVVKDLPEMLDCMALAGAAGISVGRLNSFFNSSDRGDILEGITELPIVYPVANSVTGELENRLATFMLQSLVTAGIFVVLLLFWLFMKRKGKSGDTALMFALLYGAAQTILDSTRYDSLFFRTNGFVSMVQIAGAVGLFLAILVFSVRLARSRSPWYLLLWVPVLGLLGGAGYMEYYVQRHGDEALFAYTIMAACLIGVILLGIVTYILAVTGEHKKRKLASKQAEAVEEAPAEAEEIAAEETTEALVEAAEALTEEAPAEEIPAEETEEQAEEVALQ